MSGRCVAPNNLLSILVLGPPLKAEADAARQNVDRVVAIEHLRARRREWTDVSSVQAGQ